MKKYLCLPVLVLVFLIPSFAQDAPVQMKKMVYKTVDNLELYADMFYVEGQQITVKPLPLPCSMAADGCRVNLKSFMKHAVAMQEWAS
jgi:hypothetical protein